MEEKNLYQITDRYGDKAIAFEWCELPEEIMDDDSISEYIYNIMAYSPSDGINVKTVVYFRKVKKFRRGITEYQKGDIVYGI